MSTPLEAYKKRKLNPKIYGLCTFELQPCSEPKSSDVEDGMPVNIIEESLKHFLAPFYNHCRCTGWSPHFVSKQKSDTIIPVDDEWNKTLDEGAMQTHLVHELIPCNGCGHMIYIKGVEGGSKNLCGKEAVDLLERLCKNLRARKITVEDFSKRRSLDLRLLHGLNFSGSFAKEKPVNCRKFSNVDQGVHTGPAARPTQPGFFRVWEKYLGP